MEMEEKEEEKTEIISSSGTFIEWEQIQSSPAHDHNQYPPDPNGRGGGDWSMVHQIFPPVNHEGLHALLRHDVREINLDRTAPPSPPRTAVGDTSVRLSDHLDFGLELFRFKVAGMVSWLRNFYANRGFLWSFQFRIPLVGSMALLLLYLRFRRRRRIRRESIGQLIRVIKEKDEKIHQLLHQIARMNEVLLASHLGVPNIKACLNE